MAKLEARIKYAGNVAILITVEELAVTLSEMTYDDILDVVKYVDRSQADSEFTRALKRMVKKL